MLVVEHLSKSFGAVNVTKDVSFSLERGERRVILGPNGAGKTTLFNQLVGEVKPDTGLIILGNEDISDWSVDRRAQAGLARSYQKNTLFDSLSVRENLSLSAMTSLGKGGWLFTDAFHDREVVALTNDVASQVALTDFLDHRVDSISYGMRRQLEVGIALASQPRVLLMDEPTSGVGPEMIGGFHQLLSSLPKSLTLLIVEHDMDLAFDIADQILVLNYGEVVFEGSPEEARGSALLKEIYLGSWEDA